MFMFKQKTAYWLRISDWSSDVCSSDLARHHLGRNGCAVEQYRPVARGPWPLAGSQGGVLHAQPPRIRRTDGGLLQRPVHPCEHQLSLPPRGGVLHLRRFRQRGHFLQRRIPRLHRRTEGSVRSEEHTSELQSLMRISYAVFCLKKKKKHIHEKESHTSIQK